MLCNASNTLVKSSDEVAAALGVISPLDQTQPLTKFTRCSELLTFPSPPFINCLPSPSLVFRLGATIDYTRLCFFIILHLQLSLLTVGILIFSDPTTCA